MLDVLVIPTINEQRKLAVTEPTVTRLAALVDAPTFDDVNPAPDELLVSFGDKVKKTTAEDPRRVEHTIVSAILDVTIGGEAVKDERGADGLLGERVEAHRRCVWGSG
jgi:hypothetical protein